ncbi:DUF2975 domain-containing protein [Mesonia aestuariivivens]|uniref:DUF2975 domain-containing protein n=1 Tax=Mesonia aestuariivivens TaxID=2796128 RepID=A0ABS6VZQ7_9FLAO|nr:DUF2975 domain-containing protein [Mesonia aestuariivivens]
MFINENIKSLKHSGIYATASSLIALIAVFSTKIISTEHQISPEKWQMHLIIFTLVTGISFIVMSKILAESTKLKEENELTI